MKRQVQWQYMVLTKGDGLLITAGERKGRRQSNCQTQESMWWYRQGKAGTVYLEIWFPPPLSGVFPTCSCSSPSKYSYQGFSLTPPFPRKLSVLLLQLVSLASKSPDALSVRMTFLLHPDFCLHRPASHTRERGSTRWLCTAVAGALGFLPPATARPLSPTNTTSHCLFSGRGCDEPDPNAEFPSGWADCSLETRAHEMGKSHACQLQLLLAVKMAAPPVQAASFYKPSQMTFRPSWFLSQSPRSMIFATLFLFTGFRDTPGLTCWK